MGLGICGGDKEEIESNSKEMGANDMGGSNESRMSHARLMGPLGTRFLLPFTLTWKITFNTKRLTPDLKRGAQLYWNV